jgi:hypothetical protein
MGEEIREKVREKMKEKIRDKVVKARGYSIFRI